MIKTILITACILVFAANTFADIPKTLNYQGRLMNTVGQPVIDGQYSVTFRLYDALTGGDMEWSEIQTVSTTNGYFHTVLGNISVFSSNIFDQALWIEMQIGSAAAMTPRQQLGTAAYAMTVADGAIITSKIADGAVTADKIADGAIGTVMTSDGSITSLKLADNAVTTVKIADGAITSSKVAVNAIVPSGAMVMWPTEIVPEGWLACEGQVLDKNDYANLFAAIGTRYGGSGDDFILPDFRGYFVRGWDHSKGIDPNRLTRDPRGDGTTGDMVGTTQQDQFKSHTHSYSSDWDNWSYGDHSEKMNGYNQSATTGSTGGNETRPKNIYTLYIIKK
jgi:microcystin-dependent protein